jgi:hypothetical protein
MRKARLPLQKEEHCGGAGCHRVQYGKAALFGSLCAASDVSTK